MRGTTPKLIYDLPFDASMVAKAKVVIKQGETLLLRKNTADCTLSGSTLSLQLTREDTVKLPDDQYVSVQLEVETPGGDSLVTVPTDVYTGRLLDEEALI